MDLMRFGSSAFLVETAPEAVAALWRALRDEPPPGVVDVVAGATSILLRYDSPAPPSAPKLPDPAGTTPPAPRTRRLPVIYDGPDLAEVAHLSGLSPSAVAAAHAAATYTVALVGFSPGFAYLSGGDRRLRVARLDSPRKTVPAGSVAVAAGMTAVYPQSTPGGWRLIGRTDATLFDPAASDPALLAPGDVVRFAPVTTLGALRPWPEPALLADDSPPGLEVLGAAGAVTVQDRGRPGWAKAGVPWAGSADRRSAETANALVGNEPAAAVLEVTLGWCHFRLLAPAVLAVTGAPGELTVGGLPARSGRPLALPAGTEVMAGPPHAGVHTYVAFSGGLEVVPVLGSRCRDTLSGLGPRPLQPGDRLGLGGLGLGSLRPGRDGGGGLRPARPAAAPPAVLVTGPASGPPPGFVTRPASAATPTPTPRPGEVVTLRVERGPAGAASRLALQRFVSTEWTVTAERDRAGVRLGGAPLPDAGAAQPTGMVAGAVQLPPGGQPVVLLRNHPSTGGYPVIAVVDDTGVDTLSQCRAGVRIRVELGPAG